MNPLQVPISKRNVSSGLRKLWELSRCRNPFSAVRVKLQYRYNAFKSISLIPLEPNVCLADSLNFGIVTVRKTELWKMRIQATYMKVFHELDTER